MIKITKPLTPQVGCLNNDFSKNETYQVQSQYNELKRALDRKEKQSKLDKYLCFAI
jgi:hypothetical protein